MKTLGQLKLAAARRPFETAYWQNRFPRGWQKVGFIPDRTPAGHTVGARAAVDIELDAAIAASLDRITRGNDLALHTALAAGLVSFLHLYTGSDNVVIGQPLLADADRTEEPLAWALPVTSTVDSDRSLRELVLALRESVQDAVRRQDYPFEILADHIGLVRDGAGSPFFDVLIRLDGLHQPIPADALAVPVVFAFAHHDGELRLSVDYDTARFDESTARRIAGHFNAVLGQLVADPGLPLRDVVLRTAEDDAWLDGVTAPETTFDTAVRIHELFERRAAERPDALAVSEAGDRYTYADLDRRANQLAWTLRAKGVGPDVVVGVLAERSFEMLVAVLATLKAGGAYLPLDPTYPKARLDYLLGDSGATFVLAQGRYTTGVGEGIDVIDLDSELSYDAKTDRVDAIGSAGDLAYVIYTSGSTGTPKGVAVEHRAVINRIGWMQRAYPIDVHDVILQKTPTSFDVSVWELFWWAFEGASVCLLEPGGERNPDALVEAIDRAGVTTMHFVPTMLTAFLEYVDAAAATPRLAGLRQVFASGEALSPHAVRRFHEVLGRPNGTRLVNLYGPTEATVDVSHHACDNPEPARVPIGQPIDNIRLYVVDERLRIKPVGVPGELCIAGVGLARGYLHREDLTRERFVENPFPQESRVYRTGDLARWLPDGSIEYLGRIDHQVKVRGFRIEPGEIEAALRTHPAVTDAAVIPRVQDGQQTVLNGYAVTGGAAGERELADHLRRTLPDHMVPSRIVVLDAMPLTPNGKLDRRALPDPQSDPSPAREFAAPAAGTEELLAGIWAEALGVERVDPRDNFFAVGGDSIHFVVVLAKARAAGLNFSFQEFFQHPTVTNLAAYLAERDAGGGGAAETADDQRFAPFALVGDEDRAKLGPEVADAYPMSMLQAGLIFQSEIMRGTAQYHDIISYLIQSPFDEALFTRAVESLVRRNPMMRTTYHLTGFSEYMQVVHRDAPLPLQVVDLRGLDAGAQQRWYDRWLVEEKERRFSWEQPGTLIALYVQILDDGLWRYNISLHNSTLDGWSINLVHAEVFDAYNRLRAGQPLPPDEPDSHLRDYLGLERRSLASAEESEFWRGILKDSPRTTVPALMAKDTPFSVVISHFDISRELSDRVLRLAETLAVPVKNVLLAAHMRVLAVINGENDVMTGYEHSGRPELAGADRSIGLFLNTIPFRLEQRGGSWADLVRQVYLSEIDFLPHRRYPMAKMKQDIGTQEPLFETTFNFTHFYLLKDLKRLPEFNLLDVQVQAETEFVLRTEFSRHFFHDNVRLSLHYHADVMSEEQADRVGRYYIRALELMTDDPAGAYTVPLLADDETDLVVRAYSTEPAVVVRFGAPADGGRVYILDDHLAAAPIGTAGRVVVSEPSRDGQDADPFRDGFWLRHTGKRGRWTTAGRLELVEEESPALSAGVVETTDYIAPGTPTQSRIAEAWARVLDVPVEEIGLRDDFFELGGNSLAAMRAVMVLGGLVSLIDLMRHSRLEELAELVDGTTKDEQDRAGHLRALTDNPASAKGTLVCFPFAAGHPSNFLDLATAMGQRRPDIAVYAVELPGHDPNHPDEPFQDTRATAELIADELAGRVTGPLLLWGHCGGAAVTVEVGRVLEERNADLRHVFIGAKLFPQADVLREAISYVRAMTDTEVIDWLIDATGFTQADGLEPDQQDFICRMFRHDVVAGHTYFLGLRERPDAVRLSVPITFVGAKDDKVIADYRDAYTEWGRLAAGVRLREIEHGGHYFARTRAADVASIVDAVWSGVGAEATTAG